MKSIINKTNTKLSHIQTAADVVFNDARKNQVRFYRVQAAAAHSVIELLAESCHHTVESHTSPAVFGQC